ncbi:MAG: DUF2721 domain-containing protein [Woeseia sp.]
MDAVAAVIQLSVAPVFLLAGIGALLTVLSNRLGRITDRARVLERRIATTRSDEHRSLLTDETAVMWNRIRIINWALRLCAGSALLICLVIISLFVGEYANVHIADFVAVLFVLSLTLIFVALLMFLREVGIATKRMQIGLEFTVGELEDRTD